MGLYIYCDLCYNVFSHSDQMAMHLEKFHDVERKYLSCLKRYPYTCDKCKALFGYYDDLNTHLRSVHDITIPEISTELSRSEILMIKSDLSIYGILERPALREFDIKKADELNEEPQTIISGFAMINPLLDEVLHITKCKYLRSKEKCTTKGSSRSVFTVHNHISKKSWKKTIDYVRKKLKHNKENIDDNLITFYENTWKYCLTECISSIIKVSKHQFNAKDMKVFFKLFDDIFTAKTPMEDDIKRTYFRILSQLALQHQKNLHSQFVSIAFRLYSAIDKLNSLGRFYARSKDHEVERNIHTILLEQADWHKTMEKFAIENGFEYTIPDSFILPDEAKMIERIEGLKQNGYIETLKREFAEGSPLFRYHCTTLNQDIFFEKIPFLFEQIPEKKMELLQKYAIGYYLEYENVEQNDLILERLFLELLYLDNLGKMPRPQGAAKALIMIGSYDLKLDLVNLISDDDIYFGIVEYIEWLVELLNAEDP